MAAESALSHVSDVVSATGHALPWTVGLMTVDPPDARRLGDPDTVDAALARAARRWPDVSATTCATLWWYGSSSTLALVVASQLLVTGKCIDPGASVSTVSIGGTGTLEAVTSSSIVDAVDAPDALADVVDLVVRTLCARVPGLSAPSLWAVASDSVANRTLDAVSALGRIEDASPLIASLTSRPRAQRFPEPRLVDVTRDGSVTPADDGPPAAGTRRFLRRSSCCLVFEAGESMCTSCPRRTPADRAHRWSALVG
ncbi:hypothetical protein ASG56_19055 [Rhodococcus sp. Leaf7]|uniref:(2Fe-2S)-binding protein n=1 Tax=unclassified Rhodococcus (in: high G+C Gram-positive bacteria) TaxID=192944 RepID=UPI0006F1E03F|nr:MULTISPECIES: (2Fe-2S)-binding protein [unclassified Rhodococcus (in: high G+C Gram-positive bacteria)]KQU02931.1 hypothetical protein ASG56_19055 [Rhodococcus sp. Leaf7]KQU38730.1 hypothetical protein ASG64_16540 [Rhodococcus sp. Leaf247]